jgi:ubiquinone/menaquinone biosynthesis C-methylase UbiE
VRDYKADSKAFFDSVAPRYDRHPQGKQSQRLYQRVVSTAKAWGFKSALDVGCGQGSLLLMLRTAEAKAAGADISPKMIEEAKERLGKDADLRVADSENLPWEDDSFDLVVSTASFHHYPDPIKALSEMKRVLKMDGHVIVADAWLPFPLRLLANLLVRFTKEGDVRVYSQAEFERMMKEVGFDEVRRTDIRFGAIIMQGKVRGD